MPFQLTDADESVSLDDVLAPTSCALLVIDMQNDLQHPNYGNVVDRIATLVAAARSAGCFIVFVKNRVLDDDMSNSVAERTRRRRLGLALNVTMDGTKGQEIVDALEPLPQDPVVFKHRLDAFYGTSLEQLLRIHGVSTVVITGVATHGCVTATSYAAQARDFHVVVARDGVASWDKGVHDACLTVLKNTMGFVADSAEINQAWSRAAAAIR